MSTMTFFIPEREHFIKIFRGKHPEIIAKELDQMLLAVQTLARKYPYTLDDIVMDSGKVALPLPVYKDDKDES